MAIDSDNNGSTGASCSDPIQDNAVVLAPMVRGSELAFRMLIRERGGAATECYSPMLRAEHVVSAFERYNNSQAQGCVDNELHEDSHLFLFDSCSEDRPLIVQLCGNSPAVLYEATRAIIQYYDQVHNNPVLGIDLNLGCPQRCAKEGGFGAFLVENDPTGTFECVAAMKKAILDNTTTASSVVDSRPAIRLSCKIRILDTVSETIELARGLQDAGCDILTVHCRTRITKHDGPADLEAGRRINEALSIPVWINGASIESRKDVKTVLEITGASTVMVARDFLRNHRLLVDGGKSDPAELAAEYLEYAQRFPPPSLDFVKTHIRWIFRGDCQPKDAVFEYSDNWRHSFWTFLVRPYLKTLEQFRHVVALYVSMRGGEMPRSLQDIQPIPTYRSIRHGCNVPEDDDDDTEEYALGNLFQ